MWPDIWKCCLPLYHSHRYWTFACHPVSEDGMNMWCLTSSGQGYPFEETGSDWTYHLLILHFILCLLLRRLNVANLGKTSTTFLNSLLLVLTSIYWHPSYVGDCWWQVNTLMNMTYHAVIVMFQSKLHDGVCPQINNPVCCTTPVPPWLSLMLLLYPVGALLGPLGPW